jgi:hypothetical protein
MELLPLWDKARWFVTQNLVPRPIADYSPSMFDLRQWGAGRWDAEKLGAGRLRARRCTASKRVAAQWLLAAAALTGAAAAAPKPHVIIFGKTLTVQWFAGTEENKPLALKVRALFVDGRLKEYTLGSPHEITDRLFVIRRAFRVNDSLPQDSASALRWQWQRGGWFLVDRLSAHISQITLPEFDPYYSVASWYRDYVVYCGVSDEGKKIYAVVSQLGRRKPVLKKAIGGANDASGVLGDDAAPDSACPSPAWQRSPVRVSFEAAGGVKQTFAVRGHVVDLATDAEENDEGSK